MRGCELSSRSGSRDDIMDTLDLVDGATSLRLPVF